MPNRFDRNDPRRTNGPVTGTTAIFPPLDAVACLTATRSPRATVSARPCSEAGSMGQIGQSAVNAAYASRVSTTHLAASAMKGDCVMAEFFGVIGALHNGCPSTRYRN